MISGSVDGTRLRETCFTCEKTVLNLNRTKTARANGTDIGRVVLTSFLPAVSIVMIFGRKVCRGEGMK